MAATIVVLHATYPISSRLSIDRFTFIIVGIDKRLPPYQRTPEATEGRATDLAESKSDETEGKTAVEIVGIATTPRAFGGNPTRQVDLHGFSCCFRQ